MFFDRGKPKYSKKTLSQQLIGVTWLISLLEGGGGGTKSTMGVRNFNLQRSRVRKRRKFGLNQSLIYAQPFPHAQSIFFAPFQFSSQITIFFLPWHNSPPPPPGNLLECDSLVF